MKSTFILLAVILCCTTASWGQDLITVKNPDVITGTLIKVTGRLESLKPDPRIKFPIARDINGLIGEDEDGREGRKGNPAIDPNALPKGLDPRLQTFYSPTPADQHTLVQSFNGIGFTGVGPADPALAVGPNHVIQMVNNSTSSFFRIFNKTGGLLLGSTLFSTIHGLAGAGDPIVLYDQLADRWMMSEFAPMGTNRLIVAVSTSPNPLGTWFVYSYTTPSFPDYPKYALWNNMYVVTTNEATNAVYALDRARMLAGLPAPTAQRFTIPRTTTIGFQATTPVCLEGPTPPPAGSPAVIMRMIDDAWTAAADVDRLEMWHLTINFTNPALSTLVQQPNLNTAPFDSGLCGFTTLNCITQQGTTQRLDPLREVLMNKIIYRNFGSYQALVCNHAVDVTGTDRAGVRWYEVRRGGLGAWSIFQQGTFSPDANNRWMGSIGLDANGGIGLLYNVSGATAFPSLRFTGRRRCDPPGTMTTPEISVVAGTAANNNNRYGDYNTLTIDPSNGTTFWGTGMFNTSANWSTRICSFSLDLCPDLYVKDRPADDGTEPFVEPGGVYWASEDIWVRRNNDNLTGHENPLGGAVNYIYVRVRNRTNVASPGTDTIKAYWAKASSSLSWPNPWLGGVTVNCPSPVSMGGFVVGRRVLPLSDPATAVYVFPWTAPNPANYTCFGGDRFHFCLMARIENTPTFPFGMTFPEEVGNLVGNVSRNNNIAWKNVSVTNTSGTFTRTAPIRSLVNGRTLLPNQDEAIVTLYGNKFMDGPKVNPVTLEVNVEPKRQIQKGEPSAAAANTNGLTPNGVTLNAEQLQLETQTPVQPTPADQYITINENGTAFNFTHVDIDLGQFMTRWVDAGARGEDISIIDEVDPETGSKYQLVRLLSPKARIIGIPIDDEEFGPVTLRFTQTKDAETPDFLVYDLDLRQIGEDGKTLIGGENYRITIAEKNLARAAVTGIRVEENMRGANPVTITVNNTGEKQVTLLSKDKDNHIVELRNSNGQLLMTTNFSGTTSLRGDAYPKGVYIISIINSRTKQRSTKRIVW